MDGTGSLGDGGLWSFPVWPGPSPPSPEGLASLGSLSGTCSVLSWSTRSASADWTFCFSRRQRHEEVSSFDLASLLGFAASARVSLAPESRVMAGRRAGVCPASGQSGVVEGVNCPVSLKPSGALWRLMTNGNATEPRPRGIEEHPSFFPRDSCSFRPRASSGA